MADGYIAIFLLLGFFILIAFRLPVAVALGLTAFAGLLIDGLNVINYVTQMYRGLDIFMVLAIPFFIMTGYLAANSSITTRLLELATLLVGRIRGSLGHINVVVSMIFAGVSGTATADTAGIGSVLIPMMIKRKYPAAYAAAITATTSTIGSIIPPSMLMIVYSAYANVSIGAMFLGGVVPGVFLGLVCMAYNFLYTRRHGLDRHEGVTIEEVDSVAGVQFGEKKRGKVRIVLGALPALLIPVIIVWGVTGGIFTATEAGFVALIYTLLVLLVVYRDLALKQLVGIVRSAFLFYALPLLASGSAVLLGWVLAYYGMGEAIRSFVELLQVPGWGFLLFVVLLFTVAGTFLDGFPAIVLFAPMLLDTAYRIGIHPIHLGLIIVLTLAMGLTTPPYGLCFLIAGKIANIGTKAMIKAMLPFWLCVLAVILVSVFLPDVILAVPRWILPELF